MKKLKAFSLKKMSILSNEEMARINGGEFLKGTCTVDSEGSKCYIGASNGVYTGTCRIYYVEFPGSTYSVTYKYAYCDQD